MGLTRWQVLLPFLGRQVSVQRGASLLEHLVTPENPGPRSAEFRTGRRRGATRVWVGGRGVAGRGRGDITLVSDLSKEREFSTP